METGADPYRLAHTKNHLQNAQPTTQAGSAQISQAVLSKVDRLQGTDHSCCFCRMQNVSFPMGCDTTLPDQSATSDALAETRRC